VVHTCESSSSSYSFDETVVFVIIILTLLVVVLDLYLTFCDWVKCVATMMPVLPLVP
jgi:hypothetical protein